MFLFSCSTLIDGVREKLTEEMGCIPNLDREIIPLIRSQHITMLWYSPSLLGLGKNYIFFRNFAKKI